ncbi:MAG: diacylglycerol kinase family protein [Rhizobiaceae bacterium]
MKCGVILNPVAGAGKASKVWPEFEAELARQFGAFDLRRTNRPDEAVLIAEAMAREGYELIVAAGGDGTISETADGILRTRDGPSAAAALGILPCGTGSDLARTLKLDGTPADAVRRLIGGTGRLIDAGRVSFTSVAGRKTERHFINIASLGLSGPTSRAVNAAKRSNEASGQLVFMWHTIKELVKYQFQTVRITVDDQPPIEARIALVAAANGRYFGGGMMIAPDAIEDDGLIDLVIFRGAAKLKLIFDLRLLYTGSHRDHPQVTILRGKKVLIEPVGDPLMNTALLDVDGEAPGQIPALFEVLPKAIRVMC